MNSYITFAVVVVIKGIGLGLVKIAFWSALVITSTLLALPGFIIWITSAYLFNFSAILVDKSSRLTTNLTLKKLPRKASMR
jgi:hypothetical protein